MTTLSLAIKKWLFDRNSVIFLADVALFVLLLNTLPFEPTLLLASAC